MIWPVAGRARPRKRHIPNILSRAAEDLLATTKWQTISWRTGTKGGKDRSFELCLRFAGLPGTRVCGRRRVLAGPGMATVHFTMIGDAVLAAVLAMFCSGFVDC